MSQHADRPKTIVCPICGQGRRRADMVHREVIHEPVSELIQKKHPHWPADGLVCLSCLNHFRADYVKDVLETERGELSQIEQEVVRSLREQGLLAVNINPEFDRRLTFGERLADRIADFGGSWVFITLFLAVFVVWMLVNVEVLRQRAFDPYPFILLNLVLSGLAALQAPVIMMSQNRQEAKDRLRAENDYRINLKAELQIRHLNAKMDQLLNHQWQRLLEIQEIQMQLMQDLRRPGRQPEAD